MDVLSFHYVEHVEVTDIAQHMYRGYSMMSFHYVEPVEVCYIIGLQSRCFVVSFHYVEHVEITNIAVHMYRGYSITFFHYVEPIEVCYVGLNSGCFYVKHNVEVIGFSLHRGVQGVFHDVFSLCRTISLLGLHIYKWYSNVSLA